MYFVARKIQYENEELVMRRLAIPTRAVAAGALNPKSFIFGRNRQKCYFEISRQHDTEHPLSRVSTGFTVVVTIVLRTQINSHLHEQNIWSQNVWYVTGRN